MKVNADVVVMQELWLAADRAQEAINDMQRAGWCLHLGPLYGQQHLVAVATRLG